LSTAARPRPRPRPGRHPHRATPRHQPGRRPSTPSTGPFSTAGYLFIYKLKKNNGVDGAERPGQEPPDGTRTWDGTGSTEALRWPDRLGLRHCADPRARRSRPVPT